MLRPLARLLSAPGGIALDAAAVCTQCVLSRYSHSAAAGGAAAAAAAHGAGGEAEAAGAATSPGLLDIMQRIDQLTPEQQQQLASFQRLLQRPGDGALQAALTTSLTAAYRNLYVTMDQFHKKDILGIPRPLVDTPPTPQEASQDDSQPPLRNTTQQSYPIRDLTQLPDVPPPGLQSHLRSDFMGQATCWQQMLPNHVEVSYQVGSYVYLWPAMEAFYPFILDEAAIRASVRPFVKLRRLGKRRHRKGRLRPRVGFLGYSGQGRPPTAGEAAAATAQGR